MSKTRTVFRQNRHLFFFLIGLVVVSAMIMVLWQPLLPFLLGFLMAYLLLPAINWIDRKLSLKKLGSNTKRMIISIIVIILLAAALAFIFFEIFSSLFKSFGTLLGNAPTIITEGLKSIQEWLDNQLGGISAESQTSINNAINNIGSALGGWMQQSFSTGISFIFSTFTFVLGFCILPFFLIFFMTDVSDLNKGFYSLFPEQINYHIRNFIKIMDDVFGRYTRAQFLRALITGVIVTVSLVILGVPLAPALGFIAAVFELIPNIGGAISAVIGILVTLAISPDKIWWVIIIYAVVNLVIDSILIAKLSSSAVRMNTSIVMILIVVGGYMGGLLGMFLIVPIVAVIYAMYKYTREEMHENSLAAGQQESDPTI